MTERTVQNGLRMLRAMQDLPDGMLEAARLPDTRGTGGKDRDSTLWARLGNSPWVAAAAAVVVAFSVLALIVWAGRNTGGSGHPPVAGTAEHETTPVSEGIPSETETDAETEAETEAPTEPGTAEPPVEPSADMRYAFVCGQQVAEPLEGLWWCEIVQDDGTVLSGDGNGLSFGFMEGGDVPTITVSASNPFLLTFVCHTEETLGGVALWDETGWSTLAYQGDLAGLSDYLTGKPGVYHVTVDVHRESDREKALFTEGIRLVVE